MSLTFVRNKFILILKRIVHCAGILLKYELTKHASEVIKEREILMEYIERVINSPELIESDSEDDGLQHLMMKIKENDNRILKVIVAKDSDPVRIITAYYDRSMRGKL
jgi:hypothetical protein